MASLLPDQGVVLEDWSDRLALIAVQGPSSRELLQRCKTFGPVEARLEQVAYYRNFRFDAGGEEVIVTRTGYTGELGFEIFLPATHARAVWDDIVSHGDPLGLSPVGLAARDTLRFEASFCLYGNELDDETTPLEAGLRWVVKFKKRGGFVGMEALQAARDGGTRKKLVGLELEGKNIARHGYPVMSGDEVVGRVTSGSFSPTLSKSLCMAYLETDRLGGDRRYAIQIRKKQVGAHITSLPFYASRAK